jgi:hypothetical protein
MCKIRAANGSALPAFRCLTLTPDFMKHVTISLTIDEAIALNNYTMGILKTEPNGRAAINRAARKLLKKLNEVSPV